MRAEGATCSHSSASSLIPFDSGNFDDEFDDPRIKHNVVVWVPDSQAKTCRDCRLPFNLVRRRHHCRACGQVFCSECTMHKLALPSFGYKGAERVRLCVWAVGEGKAGEVCVCVSVCV